MSDFVLPRFYPILDTAVIRQRSFDVVKVGDALLGAGAQILQYRHKDDWTEADYRDAERLHALCDEAGAWFLINDRADFASMLGTGLHVGQYDLPPVAARKLIGSLPMGFSTHNRRQLTYGNEEPVEYLSIGPLFPTTSKLKPDPVVAIAGLRTLRPLTKKKLVGIGGITLSNVQEVLSAGADSAAVISGFLPDTQDYAKLGEMVKEWLKATG